jgi:SAM-dependent methyltransferase
MADDSKIDYKSLIANSLADEGFVSATFSGQQEQTGNLWEKVIIRPVMIKNVRHMQFNYHESRKATAKNYTDAELPDRLEELYAVRFKNIYIKMNRVGYQIQITRKGKALISRHVLKDEASPDLSHDRAKKHALSADDAYWKAVGIMTADGKVRAEMQDKYRQVVEFLKLIEQAGSYPETVRVVDCGCGNAYLTFAVYHYLRNVLNLSVHMTGIDTNIELMERHAQTARDLGYDGLHFEVSSIIGYDPADAPDVVLALHACDTATDEALAQAIRWNARWIFSVPCCHQHLQAQMQANITAQTAPETFRPVLRYGVFRERLGDILTDDFRALILSMHAYKTDVIEFVTSEHTGKNLMIRAVRGSSADPRYGEEYGRLKAFWNVTPYLETLIRDAETAN